MHLSRAIPAAMAMTLTLFASAAQAAPTITQSAAGNGPFQLARGADSNVWFTDSPNPGAIGRVTQGGTVTTFTAATSALQNDARPTGITAGPGGLWFTENSKDKIGRITTSGVVSEFSDGSHNDPEGIAAGPDGNLWYTATGSGGAIARITPTGTITEYTAGLTTNGDPRDITAGPDGNLWFTAPATGRIGRITTAGVITQFGFGTLLAAPQYITAGPDGNLWFTESGSSTPAIGRITPAGVVTQFTAGLPAGSVPQDITSGADGNLYFTDSGANAIGKITPTGTITQFSSGLTASAGLRGITTGGDGRLWFAEQSVGKIGQMTVAPTASAVSESAVSATTATVSATVTPNSQATTYHFEYGQTTAYEQSTSTTAAGSGKSAVPVSAPLSGLLAETSYHVRLVAVNPTGTSYGPDHVFTTTAPGAPIATSLPATGVTTTGATLNARVNPNNAPTTYHFEYGDAVGSYPSRVPAGDATVGSDGSDHDVSEALGPLVSNKTYHFRVVATSASGTTYGDDLSFAMAALAPAATTTAATAVTTTGATLNATINPENAATTYHFEYGPSSGTSLEQAPDIDADVGADELDHAVDEPITGLTPSTAYSFRVVATSSAGITNSTQGTFTTAALPPVPDAAPPVLVPITPVPAQPPLTPNPIPTLGTTAVASVVSGTVRVRVPGSSSTVELSGNMIIPSGTVIDTRSGTLALKSAVDTAGRTQSAKFRGAVFRASLSRRTVGRVDVTLTGKPTGCARTANRAIARTARRSKPPIKLWSKDSRGKYRTHGRNSVATVRGTEWTTTETCAGTRTRVIKGAVSVLDKRSRRSRIVRAGRTYLARAAT